MSTPYHIQLIKNRLIRIGAIDKPKPTSIEITRLQRIQTLALFRSALRETKKIKHDTHLRDWFLEWFRSSFKKNKQVASDELLRTKLKRGARELRCIRNLNAGSITDLDRALKYAYARVGPSRHEIMQRILSQPSPPARHLIKNDPRGSLPRYPALLRHLLTNQSINTESPVDMSKLVRPPTLPDRADPTSEDAHLLGPLPQRREKNIHWRYYNTLLKDIRMPLGSVGGPYDVAGLGTDTFSRLERLAKGHGDDGSKLGRAMKRAYRRILGITPHTKYIDDPKGPPDRDEDRLEHPEVHDGENGTEDGKQSATLSARNYVTRISPLAVQRIGRFNGPSNPHTMPVAAEKWVQRALQADFEEQQHLRETARKRVIRKKMSERAWFGGDELRQLGALMAPEIEPEAETGPDARAQSPSSVSIY